MPEMLHKNAHFKAGGNLMLASGVGLIPVSAAVKTDMSALSLQAVSLPIEPTWKDYLFSRPGKVTVVKWSSKNRAIIGFPQDGSGSKACFGVNLQTGAWCRITGWDMRCAVELDGELYFGTPDGKVYKADGAGTDDGATYSCLYVGLYERLGSITQEKVAHMTRTTWRSSMRFNYKINYAFNYNYPERAYPSVASNVSDDLWDVGQWDVAVWDGRGVQTIQTEWRSVDGHGFAIAPMIQIQLGSTIIADIDLISTDLLYETGAIVA